jgi:alkylation response protein AidB-like acyl-CoA dehydrogenase
MRELHATTDAGADLVLRAERFASGFAEAAAEHDRDGTFAHAHVEALRDDGFLYAPLPVESGGLGVDNVHDVLVAVSRLARGDAATTIGVNMHFAVLLNVLRRWRIAQRLGQSARAETIAAAMNAVAFGGVVLASAVSEPDQDLRKPHTRATRRPDGTWVLDGRKWFCTMAPAATVLSVGVSYADRDGTDRYGFALVPKDTPGVVVHDDWDALGMRASGSNSVSFHGVELAPGSIRDGFATDRPTAQLLDRFLASGAFHAAASVGIAEAAHDLAVTGVRKRAGSHADEAFVRMKLAESTADLYAMRAAFDRAAHAVDEYDAADPTGTMPVDEVVAWFAEVQAAKLVIGDAAQRIVDRSIALSGGAGFAARHPLAKAYRDVRAGAFMHPLGANRAYRYLAEAELGEVPELR